MPESIDERLQITGTRTYLIVRLREVAEGCLSGNRLTEEAKQGMTELLAGSDSVQVGQFTYTVTDN